MKRLFLAGLMACAGSVQAAGFALYEHSASALGTAFAGQAVVAHDASTIFANPAGLTEVDGRQVVAGGHLISSSIQFSGGTPDGGNAGGLALVPSFYYAMEIAPNVKLGLGMYGPFGLKTEYDSNWVGNREAILSDLKTLNLTPAIGWRVNDRLSLGVGLDYQYIQAELSKIHPIFGNLVTVKGDDTSWGYNLGFSYRLGEGTKLGVSYRSTVDHTLTGDTVLTPPGTVLPTTAAVVMPDMASLAIEHRLSDRWSVMADATWTGWHVFDRLDIVTPSGTDTTLEDWVDTVRVAIGAEYRYNDTWSWRFGVAYDPTPVPNATRRTPRIPDADRMSVAVGGQYRASKQTKVDFGYLHIFFNDSSINDVMLPTLTGTFSGHADILGVQVSHNY